MTEPDKNDNVLSQWLDKIQQDSWQLELVISGFAIFLLIGAWQPVMDFEYRVNLLIDVDLSYAVISIFYYTLRIGYQALLFCLLVHLVLRGLWIAAIGLRSVSGDIDYDQLRYQPRFKQWLNKRIGTFDQYVERLERYCSVIFSLAFLILFCFLSLATYTVVMAATQFVYQAIFREGGHYHTGTGISLGGGWFGTIYFVFGLIYLIDFFSFGFFKRHRFTARPYYYVYRLMGWVTLARFYRPLYYNLIDDGFGRKLARFLPLFMLAIILTASLVFIKYAHFPYYTSDGKVWIDHYNYDDSREESLLGQTWRVTLNSKYATNNFVEVFSPYRPRADDPVIRKIFPNLEPARYVGVKLHGIISAGEKYNEAVNVDSLLLAFTEIRSLYVNDSLYDQVKPRFHYHETRQQPGLLYMLPTHNLPVGEHKVRLERQILQSDTLSWKKEANIYFYK
ncbi:hypothetical protein CEQ90_07065 [Lewinellaceae bacterium SD302]|nr:hypothetical protein CEQ90_07065 [Lewinellaceae bacterium SD302]